MTQTRTDVSFTVVAVHDETSTEVHVYTDDALPCGEVRYFLTPDECRLYVGINAPTGGGEIPVTEQAQDINLIQPPRRPGGDDAERRDDGLDAGSLNLNVTLFNETIKLLVNANALVNQNLGEALKTVTHAASLEREGLTRASEARKVSTTAQSVITKEEVDSAIDPDTPDVTDSPGAGQNAKAEFPSPEPEA